MVDDIDRLENARREIDRIDDQLHDLLMARAKLVTDIAAAKARHSEKGVSALRPAREIQVLRRLKARHEGELPFEVLVRIWRELVAGLTRMQGPFSVIVLGGEGTLKYWDLARYYYGSNTPMSFARSETQLLEAVSEGDGIVGILPLAVDSTDANPWWVRLTGQEDTPRIIARLPFTVSGPVAAAHPEAFVLAKGPLEPSGEDVTLVRLKVEGGVSRARLGVLLGEAKLAATALEVWQGDDTELREHLISIDGALDGLALLDTLATVNRSAEGAVLEGAIIGLVARPLDSATSGDETGGAS